jgi:hypothetical protein
MAKKQIDRLFLDMDETLIASYYSERPQMTYQLINSMPDQYDLFCITHGRTDGETLVVIRDWAYDLITHYQKKIGKENVYILTRSGYDFAKMVMRRGNLPIEDHNIYSREHLNFDISELKDSNNVLVDNECYEYHKVGPGNKVRFLHGLPEKNFVQVYPFDAKGYEPDSKQYFSSLVGRINKTLKTKL